MPTENAAASNAGVSVSIAGICGADDRNEVRISPVAANGNVGGASIRRPVIGFAFFLRLGLAVNEQSGILELEHTVRAGKGLQCWAGRDRVVARSALRPHNAKDCKQRTRDETLHAGPFLPISSRNHFAY
jgi:hypothetical protein